MVFEKNKKYFSSLTEKREGYWVCDNPLFMCGNKGLFPVYRENGRYGVLNKHYHELVFKDIPEKVIKGINHVPIPNKTTRNILKFGEKDEDLLKGL
tara:strand:- start:18883 stop:19170 length:288 start_codon:yes stop_codon:yes gene_type:complete